MKKFKPFKTHEEQIEILKSKGLIIDEKAIDVLKRNNYYFLINRYKDIFKVPNTKPVLFKEGTTFNEILELYYFDRELRSIILKYIIIIENTIKSILSYEFSKKYGMEYLNKLNFKSQKDPIVKKALNSLFNSINEVTIRGIQEQKYINYYHNNYAAIPLWVIINELSLSITVKFYNLLKVEDQQIIADYFNLDNETLYSYLRFLIYYRNHAAHNQRIFDIENEIKIKKTKYHYLFSKYSGERDTLGLLIIFKIILTSDDFHSFCNELKNRLEIFDQKVNSVENNFLLEKMGLPANWEDIINKK